MAMKLRVNRLRGYQKGDQIEEQDEGRFWWRYRWAVEGEPDSDVSKSTFRPVEKNGAEEQDAPEPEVTETSEPDVLLKPGHKVEVAGQYIQVDKDGEPQNQGDEATLAQDETAPPTKHPTWRWKLVDASKRHRKEADS